MLITVTCFICFCSNRTTLTTTITTKKGINQQLSKQASNPPSLEAVTVFNKYTRENIASNTSLRRAAHNHASGGKADSKVNVQ